MIVLSKNGVGEKPCNSAYFNIIGKVFSQGGELHKIRRGHEVPTGPYNWGLVSK